jgi:hypothetical protein
MDRECDRVDVFLSCTTHEDLRIFILIMQEWEGGDKGAIVCQGRNSIMRP